MPSGSNRIKLTKSVIEALPIPETKQAIYRDATLPGLALRVTRGGVKTFVIEKHIKDRIRRITLGRFGHLTPDLARKKAQGLLADIAMGSMVVRAKKCVLQNTTLQRALDDFLAARKDLKPRTIHDYKRHLKVSFGEWQRQKPDLDYIGYGRPPPYRARKSKSCTGQPGNAFPAISVQFRERQLHASGWRVIDRAKPSRAPITDKSLVSRGA